MQRGRFDCHEEIVIKIGPSYVHDMAIFEGKIFTHRT
jgi:hypothetical protein